MKKRIGLVSNSSSSSFCIVGISRWENCDSITYVDELCKQAGFDPDEHWCNYGFWDEEDGKPKKWKDLSFVGDCEEVHYIGLHLPPLLRGGYTLEQIKHKFIQTTERLSGIKINLNCVDLHYGECSSE